MSKARNLSDFISDPAIDSTELGDGSVTTAKLGDQAVTPAKLHNTLDLSSKTVTLATDGISGNSVHGGVISDFASTGIDDNATATALRILSNGTVGINTSTTQGMLDVHAIGEGGITALHLNKNSNTGYYIMAEYDGAIAQNRTYTLDPPSSDSASEPFTWSTGNAHAWKVDGTEHLRIDSSGNVGIGTASPSNKLEVDGSAASTRLRISTTDQGASASGLILANSSKSAFNDGIEIVHGAGVTKFNDLVGETQLSVDMTNSRVGIGTTSPTQKLDVNGIIRAGKAGNSSANLPALLVAASGGNSDQAAIAIQQETTEGDTIIFGDYEPYVEYGINTDNGADRIDITSGAGSVNHFATKTLRNNAGDQRTAKKIASFNLQSGVTELARIHLHDQSGAQATIWTDSNRTGMGAYSTSYVWLDNLYVWNWRGGLDRGWGDYPSITIQNDTGEGTQTEFRIHGIGGVNGGDFSISTRCDGGYITGSDSRRKTNVETISSALDKVLALDGKTFNIVNKELEVQADVSKTGKKFGFIAQEVEDIIPEAVKYYEAEDNVEDNGYASAYSIDYPSIVALLTNAIKEQQQLIDSLNQRLDSAGL